MLVSVCITVKVLKDQSLGVTTGSNPMFYILVMDGDYFFLKCFTDYALKQRKENLPIG